MVCSMRFCVAPRVARTVDTLPMAVSRLVMAASALVVTSIVDRSPPNTSFDARVRSLEICMRLTAPAFGPTWNVSAVVE